MKTSILIFIIWAFSQTVQAGINIYLSPTGNDNNSGVQDKPLATFEGALNKIRELRAKETIDDTIFVRVQSGTYFITHALTLTDKDSGTEQSPVVFMGDERQRPVLCGGRQTSRFEAVSPDLWRVYIPEVADYGLYFEQLYVNDERRFRAQTPNIGEFMYPVKIIQTGLSARNNQTTFASRRIVVEPADVSILKDIEEAGWEDALLSTYYKWMTTRKSIKYVNALDSSVYVTGKVMPYIISGQPFSHLNSEVPRFVIENYRKALDQPGEWFLEHNGYLYYMPKDGETIENTECVYPISEKLLILEGNKEKKVAFIHFQNICFKYTSYKTPPEGNESSQAAVNIDAAVMLDNAKNITFKNCEIAHTGQHAVWFRQNCSYSDLEHCHLHDLGAGGVKIGDYSPSFLSIDEKGQANTHHITIHNNIIQHGGNIFADAVGLIVFYAGDNTITHNDIADFKYSGISVGWVWGYTPSPTKRNIIEYNHIHHLGWGQLSDMGGVYTLGLSEGTSVSNNLIHHIHSFDYGGWGLYTDEGSTGIRMENNLVYKCKNAGFHQHYGKNNVIRNNIFALNLSSQLQLSRIENHLSFSFTNNIIYFNCGLIYMDMNKDSWVLAKTVIDRNCFWNPLTKDLKFHDLDFSEWKRLGKDQHSIIADPLFVDPEHFDFRFKNERIAKKIGFKPFDYSRYGVYGEKQWKEKALLSKELKDKFERVIQKIE